MAFHIQLETSVEMNQLGVLAIIGKRESRVCGGDKDEGFEIHTDVSFILQVQSNVPFDPYFRLEFQNDATARKRYLEQAGRNEPLKILDMNNVVVTMNGESVLIFFVVRTMKCELHEPDKFLRATADKLLEELRVIEKGWLADQSSDYKG